MSCNTLDRKSKVIIYLLLAVITSISIYEINYYSDFKFLHLRFGDDLTFHNTVTYERNRFLESNLYQYLLNVKPSWAYGAIFWFMHLLFSLPFYFLSSISVLSASPMYLSLIFLIMGHWLAFKIFINQFKDLSWAVTAIIALILVPMISMSGIRFHNYSMTYFFSLWAFQSMSEMKTINRKALLKVTFISAALIGIKLAGIFIGLPLIVLLITIPGWKNKNNFKLYALCLFLLMISTILFISPSLFNFLHPYLKFQDGIYYFVNDIKGSTGGPKLPLSTTFLFFSEHVFHLATAIILILGYFLWIKKEGKSSFRPLGLFCTLLICTCYSVLAARSWHAPTYNIGIVFICLLGLKGYIFKTNSIIRTLLQVTILSFSVFHFHQNFTTLHCLTYNKLSGKYLEKKEATDQFLKLFPEAPKNSRISCEHHSICPWATPYFQLNLYVMYHNYELHLRDIDYIFVTSNTDDLYLLNPTDKENLATLIREKEVSGKKFDLIFQHGEHYVFKKLSPPKI